jgi:IS5 family transposase
VEETKEKKGEGKEGRGKRGEMENRGEGKEGRGKKGRGKRGERKKRERKWKEKRGEKVREVKRGSSSRRGKEGKQGERVRYTERVRPGVDLIKLFWCKLLLLFSKLGYFINKQFCYIAMKGCSLQKRVSKFTPKKCYEINPWTEF